MLCHRVLRTLQYTAQVSHTINRETWEALLLFLLAINQVLLSPPTIKDDVGDQLCERVLSVLFEVWLLACLKCFPSPSLWKTFQESCTSWRHRIALVEQWNRVNLALTSRLLEFTYGPSFPELKIRKKMNSNDELLIKILNCYFSRRRSSVDTSWHVKRLHCSILVSFHSNDRIAISPMLSTSYQSYATVHAIHLVA